MREWKLQSTRYAGSLGRKACNLERVNYVQKVHVGIGWVGPEVLGLAHTAECLRLAHTSPLLPLPAQIIAQPTVITEQGLAQVILWHALAEFNSKTTCSSPLPLWLNGNFFFYLKKKTKTLSEYVCKLLVWNSGTTRVSFGVLLPFLAQRLWFKAYTPFFFLFFLFWKLKREIKFTNCQHKLVHFDINWLGPAYQYAG